jgi:hypothetical protein
LVAPTGTARSPLPKGPTMAEIVNLNQFRKRRARNAAELRAEENRRKFGRTKEEKASVQHERDKADKELDDKRLE